MRRWIAARPRMLDDFREGLAFMLELGMLAGLAWWGAAAVSGLAASIALAIAIPALAAIIWGLLAAPQARIRLPTAGVLAVKTVVFGGAAGAVYSLGQHALAVTFAVLALANTTIAAMDRTARSRTP